MNKRVDPKELQPRAKFAQFLSIANQAIGRNRDHFPYKQLIEAGVKLIGDKRIGVAIYKEDPDTPHDYFTIQWQDDDDGGGTFDIIEHGKKEPDIAWKLKDGFLEKVIANPEPYLENPAKLDLDWLKTRFS